MEAMAAGNARERDAPGLWRAMEARLEVYLRSFRALSPEDREDALSKIRHAFLSAAPEGEEAARAWAYRVARNAAIDATRALKREAARRLDPRRDPDEAIAAASSPQPGPEGLALREAERVFVRRFLATLADRDRELLLLAYAEDLAYPRIAELLALPLGTVKWRIAGLKRALERRHRREIG